MAIKKSRVVRKVKIPRKRTLEEVDGEVEQQESKRVAVEDSGVESDQSEDERVEASQREEDAEAGAGNQMQEEEDDDEKQHSDDGGAGQGGEGGDEDEDENEDEDEEDDVVSSGTSTSNPNPTAPAPEEHLSLYHQPSNKKWSWPDQLEERTIEADWFSGPILPDEDGAESDYALRKLYYFMYKYNPRKPFLKQPKTAILQLAPMFVTYARMSGYGSRKFKKKDAYECEYLLVLTPKVPRNVYGSSVTVYDQEHNEFRTFEVGKDELSPELKQIERAAMMCYNGLVRLHIKELRKMFSTPHYKTSVKETQRAQVMDEMKLVIKDAGTTYVSTHDDYKNMSSYEQQKEFDARLFKAWLAHASTPFGQEIKKDSNNTSTSGNAVAIPDIPFGVDASSDMFDIPRLSINIFGDGAATTVERDDSDMVLPDADQPWYEQDKDGNYGGPWPSLMVKRNMYFGKIKSGTSANAWSDAKPDQPGTAPYFKAFSDYSAAGNRVPQEIASALDEHGVKFFEHCMNVHDETMIARRNFRQSVYHDPFFRPLHTVAGMNLLEADLKHALVSRGSIVSVAVENLRKPYPEDQKESYGTKCDMRTDVVLYAVAVPEEAERKFLSDPGARMKNLSDEEKKLVKAPVTELHLVCDATYQAL